MKIRLKQNHFFWAIMFGLLIFILGLIYHIYQVNKFQLAQLYNQQQLNLAQEMALNLEGLFDEALRDLKAYLSNNPFVKAGDLRECEYEMGLVSNKMKGVTTSLMRLDKNGVLIHIFSEDEKQKKLIGKDYRRESYFEEPKTTGRPFISNVVLEEGGKKRVYISVPLYKEAVSSSTPSAREFAGVFAFSIDLNTITNQLLSRLQKVRNFWIMDDEGNLLVQPKHPEMEFRNIFRNQGECQRCHGSFEIQERMVKGESGTGESCVKGSQKNLVAFAPVNLGEKRWSLAVVTPAFEVTHILGSTLILMLIIPIWFLIGFLYILQTNKKKAKAEIEHWRKEKEMSEKYENLFREAKDAILVTDCESGYILEANPEAFKLTGYSREELLNMKVWKLFPEDKIEETSKIFSQGCPEEKRKFSQLSLVRKDGAQVLVEVSSKLVDYEGKKVVQTIARDITERKKAEKALKESEEKYRNLVQFAHDAICIIQDDHIKFANQKFLDLSGYSWEELKEVDFKELVAPEHREMVVDRYYRRQKGEKVPERYELTLLTRNGERREVDLSVSLVEYQGKMASYCFLRDVTQNKKLQQQLIQTEKLAAVGTLAYGIAHEFNNILAGMMANAELGLISKEHEQIKECFETIVESSQRASSITNNLLAFARQKNAKKELVDITEPLKSVLSVTRRELEKHNVELIEKFKSIPKIYCDSGQFSEVFLNMITNARDAMYPKGGTLTIQVESAGDCIRIIFKDTGCGIPEEIKSKIFEPFVTTKGVLGKSDIPGTGLGLFLSYGIIDGYQGKIEVETKVGRGTRFTILIPVSKNLPRDFLLETRIESTKEIEKKLKILLVDDESPICSSLKKFLESKGHLVATSLRGKEGLELFKKDKFDLVLSDITMPDMDGIELIKKVKEKDPQAKIIVITGHIQKEKEEKAREAGADEVLIKPFKNELLYQAISKVAI
ncbi:MAG: PAS domain S-box protein [candidate division Zixibacteria bacterium]|nr:PAS domain S-box protein [candidate division Zixibacteria bacterium]